MTTNLIQIDAAGESQTFRSPRYSEGLVLFRRTQDTEDEVHLAYAVDGSETGAGYETFATLAEAESFASRHGFEPVQQARVVVAEDVRAGANVLYAGTYTVALPLSYDAHAVTGEDVLMDGAITVLEGS